MQSAKSSVSIKQQGVARNTTNDLCRWLSAQDADNNKIKRKNTVEQRKQPAVLQEIASSESGVAEPQPRIVSVDRNHDKQDQRLTKTKGTKENNGIGTRLSYIALSVLPVYGDKTQLWR